MGIVRDVTDRRLAEQRGAAAGRRHGAARARTGDVAGGARRADALAWRAVRRPTCAIELASGEASPRRRAGPTGDEPMPRREPSLVVPLRGRDGVLGTLRLSAAVGAGQRRFDDGRPGVRRRARAPHRGGDRERAAARGGAAGAAARRARGRPTRAPAGPRRGARHGDDARGGRRRRSSHEAAAALGADAAFLVVRDGAQLVTVGGARACRPRSSPATRASTETASAGTGEAAALLEPVFARVARRARRRRTRAWPPRSRTPAWRRSRCCR